MKKDSEIKLLIGCTDDEINTVYEFHNKTEYMKGNIDKKAVVLLIAYRKPILEFYL